VLVTFFFPCPSTTEISTLSLHDALPISAFAGHRFFRCPASHVIASTSRWLVGSSSAMMSQSCTSSAASATRRRCPPLRLSTGARSEEHTSELQSRENLVCRLLLEKKKKE